MAESVADRLHAERLPPDTTTVPLPTLMSLHGKRTLITGGAGPSLGQACSHRLASLGSDLVIVGQNLDRAKRVAGDVSQQWGVRAFALRGDVTDADSVDAFTAEAVRLLGGLDVLVHNAGGGTVRGKRRHGPFIEAPPEDIELVVRLNFMAVLHVVRASLAHMLPNQSGRIIVINSEAGKNGLPNHAAYAASKAGVLGFVRNLAHEIGDQGVSIVAVCPGIMLTPDVIDHLKTMPLDSNRAVQLSGFNRVTLGRCSRPDEVASMVAFLATEPAAYIHGTAISVGGGMSE